MDGSSIGALPLQSFLKGYLCQSFQLFLQSFSYEFLCEFNTENAPKFFERIFQKIYQGLFQKFLNKFDQRFIIKFPQKCRNFSNISSTNYTCSSFEQFSSHS